MSILTEEEISNISKEHLSVIDGVHQDDVNWDVWTHTFAGEVQRKVLEKLAGMELPEPVSFRDFQYQDRGGMWNPFLNEKHLKDTKADGTWPIRVVFSGDQLHQAYAQGAASQLSAEPLACIVETSDGANMVWPIADLDEARTYCADDDEPVLLHTLKTIK